MKEVTLFESGRLDLPIGVASVIRRVQYETSESRPTQRVDVLIRNVGFVNRKFAIFRNRRRRFGRSVRVPFLPVVCHRSFLSFLRRLVISNATPAIVEVGSFASRYRFQILVVENATRRFRYDRPSGERRAHSSDIRLFRVDFAETITARNRLRGNVFALVC